LSLLSFGVITILLYFFFVGLWQRFLFFSVGNYFNQFISVRWLCKLFDKALVVALALEALAMC
jgi:hypothetical protein